MSKPPQPLVRREIRGRRNPRGARCEAPSHAPVPGSTAPAACESPPPSCGRSNPGWCRSRVPGEKPRTPESALSDVPRTRTRRSPRCTSGEHDSACCYGCANARAGVPTAVESQMDLLEPARGATLRMSARRSAFRGD
jgi:hypothetical protein